MGSRQAVPLILFVFFYPIILLGIGEVCHEIRVVIISFSSSPFFGAFLDVPVRALSGLQRFLLEFPPVLERFLMNSAHLCSIAFVIRYPVLRSRFFLPCLNR